MNGILHLFDFNKASTSRKLLTQKSHSDGVEAPRNSLERLAEKSQSYNTFHESIPYSYQVNQPSLKTGVYPSGGATKKLIEEEISQQTCTKRNVPSVVARLMGMDMLPSDIKPLDPTKERKSDKTRINPIRKQIAENGPARRSSLGSKPFRQVKQDLLALGDQQDLAQSRTRPKLGKPHQREHPQEEQLQQFKKEFEAWQAAKTWEWSRSVELGNYPISKEKIPPYSAANRNMTLGFPMKLKESPQIGFQRNGRVSKLFQPHQKEVVAVRNKTETDDWGQVPLENYGKSSQSTRIVILKPGPEIGDASEESWASSPETEQCSIEHFLEEVKERLRLEIQGKGKRSTTVRGSGVETPYSERPTEPKQIARQIAKHVRENVTKDLSINLLRTESTRSCRSDFHINGPDSPEFINRDTRKYLQERLRNVLRNETNVGGSSVIVGNSRNILLENEGMGIGYIPDVSNIRKSVSPWGMGIGYIPDVSNIRKSVSPWENMKDEFETKTRSFRHEETNNECFVDERVSPRNLVRSLSAPVSGTSFGKLLLEEPRVLTGAQIRRKLEATENVSLEVGKTRKEKFNFRGRVSNLRYSLTLKGKLFGKKNQLGGESGVSGFESLKAFITEPTVLMNLGIARENSTEVPPSPASVCSSAPEEYFMPGDHPNPFSSLDVPYVENQSVPQVFKDISSNLHELRQQVNQFQSDGFQEVGTTADPYLDSEMLDLESEAHVYVRDILVAAGFYDGSTTPTNLVDGWVFRAVEKAYEKEGKVGGSANDYIENKVNHRVLFDLLNETLSTLVGPPVSRAKFIRGPLGPSTVVQQRKKLLDEVWRRMRYYLYASTDGCHSLDDMMANDLGLTHWSSRTHDENNEVGREVEWMILGDLVEEIMRDM